MPDNIELVVREHLNPAEIASVTGLVEAAASIDGARPLSEHAWLHLQHGGDVHGHHVLAVNHLNPHEIVGYAHVDITDNVQGASAELVVAPDYRHIGIGRELVGQAIHISPDGRLRLWAHGESSGAQELAQSMGFDRIRSLWQMRRSLFAPLPSAEIPEQVRIRTFDVERDIEPWLDLNRRAFIELPDQSSWTRHDLEMRLAESWFNPQGFFIAERITDSTMVGFHWTKVHGDLAQPKKQVASHSNDHQHPHEAIGEIYVLATDPQAHIRGLGRTLSIVGLAYLRSLGLNQAMLYVDSNNQRAISLYSGLGFAHWDTDVLFQRA